MTANLQPNSLSQILALALLKRWGYDGFFGHTTRVAEFYRKKRDVFQEAMLRHLSDVAEWSVPEAGMFMWYVFYLEYLLYLLLTPSNVLNSYPFQVPALSRCRW